jgi:peptidoglycan hydrolase FlgJ
MISPIHNQNPGSTGASEKKLTTEDKKLKEACTEFEAIMVRQMLEAMQGSTKMFGEGFGGSYFQSMFQDAIAKEIAGKGIGMSKMLYTQLSKTNSVK